MSTSSPQPPKADATAPPATAASAAGGCGKSASSLAELEGWVREAVATVQVVDVHTHLFPPSHGELMHWGIDGLLTYHYLISEFFMVAPKEIEYESFFRMPRSDQADLVWEHLFVRRLPISEAQIGVVTTLRLLGLGDLARARDLVAIRAWFAAQDPEAHTRKVFELAGIKYVVMTNIPFDAGEASKWLVRPGKLDALKPQTFDRNKFRTALRIDQILKGDWGTIMECLRAAGLPETMAGARQYLRRWAEIYEPEYLMASTPADFVYGPEDVPRQEGWPSATALIDEVMVPVSKELSLPLAMKLGARRGMNTRLDCCGGGDGVTVADTAPLRALCNANPDVKFLATFLSRVNQHEVCILTQKFRNLHVYGCWWYCNNPSIISEMTRMRLELLGSAFTCQHSDCRVVEQLVYKWHHSRRVVADAVVEQMALLFNAGWEMSRADVRRDVERLFGGAYEEFMAK